jgi:hypothetical protein
VSNEKSVAEEELPPHHQMHKYQKKRLTKSEFRKSLILKSMFSAGGEEQE